MRDTPCVPIAEAGASVVDDVVSAELLDSLQRLLSSVVDTQIGKWRREGMIATDYGDLPFSCRYLIAWRAAGRPRVGTRREQKWFIAMVRRVLLRFPEVSAVAAELLGAQVGQPLPSTRFRAKFPGDDRTTIPWHQDAQCLERVAGTRTITMWVPLVDVTPLNSCLEVSTYDHNRMVLPLEYSQTTGYVVMAREVAREVEKRAMAVPLSRGQMLCMDAFTPHRSTPNLGESIRWSIDLRFAPT
ncbi:MAG: phytanoyl-CoA dioxygenase family protein [Actinomycetota bacterium]